MQLAPVHIDHDQAVEPAPDGWVADAGGGMAQQVRGQPGAQVDTGLKAIVDVDQPRRS